MAAFWTIAILILTPIVGFIGQTFDLGAIFAVTAATVLLSLQWCTHFKWLANLNGKYPQAPNAYPVLQKAIKCAENNTAPQEMTRCSERFIHNMDEPPRSCRTAAHTKRMNFATLRVIQLPCLHRPISMIYDILRRWYRPKNLKIFLYRKST